MPCSVDPDSCDGGQTAPGTEGVSYAGELGGDETRDPPGWTAVTPGATYADSRQSTPKAADGQSIHTLAEAGDVWAGV